MNNIKDHPIPATFAATLSIFFVVFVGTFTTYRTVTTKIQKMTTALQRKKH